MMQSLDELHYLRELEAVKTTNQRLLLFVLILFGMSSWLVFAVAHCLKHWGHYIGPAGLAGSGVILLALPYILLRLASGYVQFSTDVNGFTARGPMRRKFIPWVEVSSARTRRGSSGHTILILKTSKGVFSVSPIAVGISRHSEACLIASVWQYLRRYGGADGIELTPEMLSLWEQVSDDVPVEVEWGKPASLFAKIGNLAGAAFLPVLVLFFGFISTGAFFMTAGMIAVCAAILKWLIWPEAMHRAFRFGVSRNGLEAHLLLRKIFIPWSRITAADWQRNYLLLRHDSPGGEIRIPYVMGCKESEQAILAVIRQLRTSGNLLPVTFPVLVSKNPDCFGKPTMNSRRLGELHRAFLYSLDPPVRKRLQKLYVMQMIAVLVGLVSSAALVFTDAIGMLSTYLHSGGASDALYFFSADSIYVGVPLMMAGINGSGFIADFVGKRLAGPYRPQWDELQRIGRSRFSRALVYIFTVIGLIGVLSVPLFVDCYIKVTDEGVTINRFMSFRESSYPWQEIRSIDTRNRARERNGRIYHSTTHQINFTDGTHWKLDEEAMRCDRKTLGEAAEFIRTKIGKYPDSTPR